MQDQDFLFIGQKLEVITISRPSDATYYSYVKDINKSEILIDQPTFKGKSAGIYVKDTIKINITTQEAIYSAKTIILKNQFMPISGCWVKRPSQFERIQRRSHLRINIKIPVNLSMVDKDGDILEIPVESRDFSGGGISFYLNEDLNNYVNMGKFYLTIKVPGFAKPCKCQAEVIFCRSISENKDLMLKYRYVAAMKFLDLEPKIIDDICKFCFQYQIELKRKGLL